MFEIYKTQKLVYIYLILNINFIINYYTIFNTYNLI